MVMTIITMMVMVVSSANSNGKNYDFQPAKN